MSWAVSVFENGKLYQRIQYKDKNKALNEFHRQGAIFVKTPFADGTNRIYVRTETIEQLEKILLEGENNG